MANAGPRAARRAVLGDAIRQRCQFHPAQNAIHHAPTSEVRKRIGSELRSVWNASTLAEAETALAGLVAPYRGAAPKLAPWLEENVPEGLAVFSLPEHHRRRLRTSNPMERSVQQEIKRRTVKVRVFPTKPRSSASSAPCWSRSTTEGPPMPGLHQMECQDARSGRR